MLPYNSWIQSVSSLGTESIATHQIVNSINILVTLMIDSIGTACQF